MDLATLLGVILGFTVIGWAIMLGGSWVIFVDMPSVAITIGGMLCATLIHFSLPQFLGVFSVVKKTIVSRLPQPSDLIQKMVNFATINRRDGAIALEQEINRVNNIFFAKGLQMVVDGQKPDEIRDLLSMEIQYLQDRHAERRYLNSWARLRLRLVWSARS
jgi:chemotaxis protein MotA